MRYLFHLGVNGQGLRVDSLVDLPDAVGSAVTDLLLVRLLRAAGDAEFVALLAADGPLSVSFELALAVDTAVSVTVGN